MITGLKGNKEGRTGGELSGSVNGIDLGMGTAANFVKTVAHYFAVFYHNGPDHRIG
jgi:hypothetical protein